MNFGHIVLEKNGNKCSCGKLGCFETYCSMKILKDKIRERKRMQYISSEEIHSIMKADYESIRDIVDEYIENLAIGISNYIDIFEPEVISIGGSFIYYKDILLDKLINRLHKGKMTFNRDIPEIITAKYRK